MVGFVHNFILLRLLAMGGSILLVLLAPLWGSGCDESPYYNPDSIRAVVAVYTGAGVLEESATAAGQAALASGRSVDYLNAAELLSGELEHFYILLVPGGDPREMASTLTRTGMAKIEEFVSGGGSYMGFGAGSVIACGEWDIYSGAELFEGSANWPLDPIAPYPEMTITDIRRSDSTHPIATQGNRSYLSLYRWGPDFEPDGDFRGEILYHYGVTETPACAAFEYGHGRVFLTGFQPEFEESAARDSTDFGSQLQDPDSEWDIIERAVDYCMWEY